MDMIAMLVNALGPCHYLWLTRSEHCLLLTIRMPLLFFIMNLGIDQIPTPQETGCFVTCAAPARPTAALCGGTKAACQRQGFLLTQRGDLLHGN